MEHLCEKSIRGQVLEFLPCQDRLLKAHGEFTHSTRTVSVA
jgi:hypothetical protein